MLALHVDPSLLTAPMHASSQDEARGLIDQLTDISAIITRDLITVTAATDCATVLATAGVFPAYSSVEQLLLSHNLANEFGAGDVVRLINNVLDRAQPAREMLDVEAIELGTCTLTPQPWGAATGPLESASQRALATVRHVNVIRAGELISASVWARCAPNIGNIHVDAIADVDSATGTHVALAAPVVGTPPLVRALDDLAANVSVLDVWAAAQTPRDFHLAIALQASALAKIPLSAVPKFTVGSSFPTSLATYQASGVQPYASVTLDICAHVLIGQPKYQISSFDQTRTRDGADAYRTHITKGGPALRLMMWDNGKIIEFANIGPKNQLSIQNGNPLDGYNGDYDWR